ncbi:Putative uncharacterized protein [Moritella viscosa]|uniref:Uncharacterized protein n=1 Tax=Moritella viscosa TaxID=80854 RepID=A0A1K9YQS0_9GAMM|nr:Putative uncharacterized protein [Moritella viscosa]SGY81862.1 Putative uncharacterized protein [Moritella viscosa]SGY81913.1 Putative uncharacterized protein [Moritella viscosa]SGY81929.1 Putative uncharacterized protein [Moritella viscosa]SGY82077.1 Putative uncharacterized protein [Moritella viscosa]
MRLIRQWLFCDLGKQDNPASFLVVLLIVYELLTHWNMTSWTIV